MKTIELYSSLIRKKYF